MSFNVVVIGSGLIGSTLACLLADRTEWDVDVYDKELDMRYENNSPDVYTNLVSLPSSFNKPSNNYSTILSRRGLFTLNKIGIDLILLPLTAKLFHEKTGKLLETQNKPIFSFNKNSINSIMLDKAEDKKVKLHFGYTLVSCDFSSGNLEFKQDNNQTNIKVYADLIIGCMLFLI